MKLFACILSIFILALTTVPCVDEPLAETIHKTDLTNNPAGSHQHESDQCSPFCTCNCCTSPRIKEQFTIDFRAITFTRKVYFFSVNFFLPEFSPSIWQPPKLV